VYSKEPAMTPIEDMSISCKQHCICPPDTARTCLQRRQVPASNAFVPAVAGLIMAGEVVRDLTAAKTPATGIVFDKGQDRCPEGNYA
jgi:tRNA A37 threonylcarbamoyladenosine dehydratase